MYAGTSFSDACTCCCYQGACVNLCANVPLFPAVCVMRNTNYVSCAEAQAYPRHSLSRAALVTAGAPIFLLDTFTNLILYYTAGYKPDIPFPPPHTSLLRRTMQGLKQQRQVTPQLKMLRGMHAKPFAL